MMLNKGVANGKQVVPADWVTESTVPDKGYEPTSEGAPFGYQYQWWTVPGSDAYMAIGLHHQYTYIDPKNKNGDRKVEPYRRPHRVGKRAPRLFPETVRHAGEITRELLAG